MTSLNLPPFDVRLKGTKQAPLIYDFLRRRYVRLTPEEWVRQHFVHFMVEHRHYPASLLANEVSLHVGDKVLRADTILYNKQLQPVMIVEYKAPHIPITQTVFRPDCHLQYAAACRLPGGEQRAAALCLQDGL